MVDALTQDHQTPMVLHHEQLLRHCIRVMRAVRDDHRYFRLAHVSRDLHSCFLVNRQNQGESLFPGRGSEV